jgi:hypothetical protein
MLTVILLFVGALVVCGASYLVMSSGTRGGRHGQSAQSAVTAQRQEAARASSVRGSGGDD